MAITDPDIYEVDEYQGIGIFVPGALVEREVDGNRLFRVLLLTGAGFALVIAITFVLTIILIAAGLIVIDFVSFAIYFAPWAFLILSIASLGFIVPPIFDAKRRGMPLGDIGIKSDSPVIDVLLGLLVGGVMLGLNFIVTYIINTTIGIPDDGAGDMFLASDPLELVAWVGVMFVIVGFTEELLFRGFLQRRMEIYYRTRSKNYRFWALVITSFIFAAVHLDLIGLPVRFMLGVFLGYLAQKRKYSILGPTVAHGFNNAAVVILASMGF